MLLKLIILYITTLSVVTIAAKECDYEKCNYEGVCLMDANNQPSCKCIGQTFFQGPECNVEVNNCASNPCKNGAKCINYIGHFNCVCPDGYGGKICNINFKNIFTNFHLHYNRLAELGKEQTFLLTLATKGEGELKIYSLDMYTEKYILDGFIFSNQINAKTKYAQAFKSSENLIALAKSLGLRNTDNMPYVLGYYHIVKGTFWQVGTEEMTLGISDITQAISQGKVPIQLNHYEKMTLQVYKPNSLSCVTEVEILNCNRVKPLLPIDVTQYNVLTPIVKKRCVKDSEMIFKWTAMNPLGTVQIHNFGESKKSILKVKPYDMSFNFVDSNYNQEYQIVTDVVEKYGEAMSKTAARCYINAPYKTIKSIIIGGPKRQVDAKTSFILDGIKSRDYYFAEDGMQYLNYDWSCTSTDDADNELCNKFDKTAAKLTVDASKLKYQKSYKFALKVTPSRDEDIGSDTAIQTITVVEGASLYIDIQCVRNCAKDQFDGTKFVHLKANCLNCRETENIAYKWTLNGKEPPSATTGAEKKRFIFTPSETETQFIVQLQLAQGQRSGTCELKLNKNLPPNGGTCTVAPTSGKAFETEFQFDCANYKDLDQSLWYVYKAPEMLLERSSNSDVKLRLPTLSNVEIQICDTYEACTTTSVKIDVSAMDVPQDASALKQMLQNDATNLRRLITDGKVRDAILLTAIILKEASTLKTSMVVLEHLKDLELLTLIEAEQFTKITIDLLKALKPLDNEKAALLAKFFRKLSTGYRNILQDGEVRELQSAQYKQLTEELTEMLSELAVPLEEIPAVHTTNVQQETDYLLAEKYPDFAKFDITVLPRIENWLQAAIELNKCIILLGHMATNMHEPDEEAQLVEKSDLSMELFATEDTTQREILSKDGAISVKLNSKVIAELQAQLQSNTLVLQVITTSKNPFWWYPAEQPLSTGVLYFNVFSRPLQKEASINREIKLQNAFEYSMKLRQPKQDTLKLLKGYVDSPQDMPIFETLMPVNSMLIVQFQATDVDLKVMLRLGVRPRGYMVKKSTQLMRANSATNENLFLINDAEQASLGYLAVLAANRNIKERAKFSFTTTLRECLSWNFLAADPEWSTQGCRPIGAAVVENLRCSCQHLTTFSGKVGPTVVQPALGERQLLEYLPINWTMIWLYLLLFGILGFLLWRAYCALFEETKDRLIIEIDEQEANKDFDVIVYFHTGGQWNAGTTANIHLSVSTLDRGLRTFIIYQNQAASILTTSSTCSVQLPIASDELLPYPMRISINHDGAGRYPSWYCNAIELKNIKMKKSFYFDVRRWITKRAQIIEASDITKMRKIKFRFENLLINWFGFQAFTGPWRCGTTQLNRSERTMIWIIKVVISICIVACYFGRTTLETYEEERERYYSFNINVLELFVLSCVCYAVGAFVQIVLIYGVLKY